jgi:hypothetical protein
MTLYKEKWIKYKIKGKKYYKFVRQPNDNRISHLKKLDYVGKTPASRNNYNDYIKK